MALDPALAAFIRELARECARRDAAARAGQGVPASQAPRR